MELTPGRFVCEEHDIDLTDLVRDELSESVPVAFRWRRPRRFEVVVECAGGSTHEVTCVGEVRYR
jgi:hypothetical protein